MVTNHGSFAHVEESDQDKAETIIKIYHKFLKLQGQ